MLIKHHADNAELPVQRHAHAERHKETILETLKSLLGKEERIAARIKQSLELFVPRLLPHSCCEGRIALKDKDKAATTRKDWRKKTEIPGAKFFLLSCEICHHLAARVQIARRDIHQYVHQYVSQSQH